MPKLVKLRTGPGFGFGHPPSTRVNFLAQELVQGPDPWQRRFDDEVRDSGLYLRCLSMVLQWKSHVFVQLSRCCVCMATPFAGPGQARIPNLQLLTGYGLLGLQL